MHSSELHQAIEADDLIAVERLLAAGARVDDQYQSETEHPLYAAACQEQGTPLTMAVSGGNRAMVALLLQHGADPEEVRWSFDGCDNYRETPLLLALQAGRLDLADLLLQHGARVDGECLYESEPHTPLSFAILQNQAEQVAWLLQHGADSDKQLDGESVREFAERLERERLLTGA